MVGYLVRRLVSAILVLIAISIAIFALFTFGPKDPARALCQDARCTPERLEAIRGALNLDEPVTQQYVEYMKGIFVGRTIDVGTEEVPCAAPCLGRSFKYGVNVTDYLSERLPATISVAVGGVLVSAISGLAFGIFAALRRGTRWDKGIVGANLILNAMPYYIWALLLYLYLVTSLGLFPDSGYTPFTDNPAKWAYALLLPWLAVGLHSSAQYARYSRGSMIESLSNDYVRTARAKGLSERKVVFQHGLRAAIVPVVTIFGIDFAVLLAGTIFTEMIFKIEGIGFAAIEAVGNGDLPIVQATTLIAAFFVVTFNVIVDLIYSVLDPRVRLS